MTKFAGAHWYWLSIPPNKYEHPRVQLDELIDELRTELIDTYGAVPEAAAVFSERTEAGGYLLLLTHTVALPAREIRPQSYLIEAEPVEPEDRWQLELGDPRWKEILKRIATHDK